jgi:hypothetical protein
MLVADYQTIGTTKNDNEPDPQIGPGGKTMKYARTIAAAAFLTLAFAAPALADPSWWQGFSTAPQSSEFQQWLATHPNAQNQLRSNPYQIYDPSWRSQHPELQQYIQSNPGFWNGMRTQGSNYYNERFNKFLSKHPGVARDLRGNPELIYDPRYRAEHPELQQFLAGHPQIWQEIKYAPFATRGMPSGYGAYDNNRVWRDADWWHQNDRAWFWKNHPEWAANHQDWRDSDGDYDDSHVWHDRDWWADKHPDWVAKHHPNWDKHLAHEALKDQQRAEKAQAREQKADKHGDGHGHGYGSEKGHGPGHHDGN